MSKVVMPTNDLSVALRCIPQCQPIPIYIPNVGKVILIDTSTFEGFVVGLLGSVRLTLSSSPMKYAEDRTHGAILVSV